MLVGARAAPHDPGSGSPSPQHLQGCRKGQCPACSRVSLALPGAVLRALLQAEAPSAVARSAKRLGAGVGRRAGLCLHQCRVAEEPTSPTTHPLSRQQGSAPRTSLLSQLPANTRCFGASFPQFNGPAALWRGPAGHQLISSAHSKRRNAARGAQTGVIYLPLTISTVTSALNTPEIFQFCTSRPLDLSPWGCQAGCAAGRGQPGAETLPLPARMYNPHDCQVLAGLRRRDGGCLRTTTCLLQGVESWLNSCGPSWAAICMCRCRDAWTLSCGWDGREFRLSERDYTI